MRGQEIRARREALGLTRVELALVVDVAPPTVGCWERGEQRVSPEHVRLLDAALSDVRVARVLRAHRLLALSMVRAGRWSVDRAARHMAEVCGVECGAEEAA